MNVPILSVRFFISENGREPVRDFLKALEKEDRRTVGIDIKTVQYGWPLGMPLVRKMAVDLWEVRIRLQSSICRVLFTVVNQEMILLHAFIKKSQKTPQSDLATAKSRLAQLKER